MKAKEIFWGFSVLFAMSILSVLVKNSMISSVLISFELIMMMIGLFFLFKNNLLTKNYHRFIIFFSIFSIVHFVSSPQFDLLSYIKILSPIVFLGMGMYCNFNLQRKWKYNKVLVLLICLLPIFLRLFQILARYPDESTFSFFVNSNNFIYYIIVSFLVFYVITKERKWTIIYLVIGILLSKTIGGFLSIFLSALFLYRNRLFVSKYFIVFIICILFFGSILIYSDFEIFERIRNSSVVFKEILNSSSWGNFKDIEYSEAINYAKDKRDLSFLFRIKNWSEILYSYKSLDIWHILWGSGFLSIPNITSTKLVAHNDYLGIIYEFGLIPSLLLLSAYFRILFKVKSDFFKLFLLAIAIFHFTENLYYNFLITSLHFFLLGLSYSKLGLPYVPKFRQFKNLHNNDTTFYDRPSVT